MKQTARIFGIAVLTLSGVYSFAQQHDHSQMQMSQGSNSTPAATTAATGTSVALGEENSIFCPTMKTGQLCSHGTAQVLGLKGADAEAWQVLARKYNKAVDAATVQLFKDAETSLTPKQVELLKAWFAVGLNPQMNELLYGKGLGEQKQQ